MPTSHMSTTDLSIVLPTCNEEESLPLLLDEIHAALGSSGLAYEVIVVDDGSVDRTFERARAHARMDARVQVVRLRRNFGQTAALQAGIDRTRGDVVALMDADLQNDPADLPAMLARLDHGFDLVAGWRRQRRDPWLTRRLPSQLANRLIGLVTGVRLHDYGCTLKVMRGDVARELRLYGEMHRFIPAIASWMGVRIAEMEVHHRPRTYGRSKYGLGRTVRVVLDLLTVRFLQSYLVRPMQVFGLAGLLSGGAGFAICLELAIEKLAHGEALADRPLLLLGALLIMVGVQLISLGLVADVVARTYHEAQGKTTYHVREVVAASDSGPARPRRCDSPEAPPGD